MRLLLDVRQGASSLRSLAVKSAASLSQEEDAQVEREEEKEEDALAAQSVARLLLSLAAQSVASLLLAEAVIQAGARSGERRVEPLQGARSA